MAQRINLGPAGSINIPTLEEAQAMFQQSQTLQPTSVDRTSPIGGGGGTDRIQTGTSTSPREREVTRLSQRSAAPAPFGGGAPSAQPSQISGPQRQPLVPERAPMPGSQSQAQGPSQNAAFARSQFPGFSGQSTLGPQGLPFVGGAQGLLGGGFGIQQGAGFDPEITALFKRLFGAQ